MPEQRAVFRAALPVYWPVGDAKASVGGSWIDLARLVLMRAPRLCGADASTRSGSFRSLSWQRECCQPRRRHRCSLLLAELAPREWASGLHRRSRPSSTLSSIAAAPSVIASAPRGRFGRLLLHAQCVRRAASCRCKASPSEQGRDAGQWVARLEGRRLAGRRPGHPPWPTKRPRGGGAGCLCRGLMPSAPAITELLAGMAARRRCGLAAQLYAPSSTRDQGVARMPGAKRARVGLNNHGPWCRALRIAEQQGLQGESRGQFLCLCGPGAAPGGDRSGRAPRGATTRRRDAAAVVVTLGRWVRWRRHKARWWT